MDEKKNIQRFIEKRLQGPLSSHSTNRIFDCIISLTESLLLNLCLNMWQFYVQLYHVYDEMYVKLYEIGFYAKTAH